MRDEGTTPLLRWPRMATHRTGEADADGAGEPAGKRCPDVKAVLIDPSELDSLRVLHPCAEREARNVVDAVLRG